MKTKKDKTKFDGTEPVEPEFEFHPEKVRIKEKREHIPAPGATEPRNCKVRISIFIDADILQEFKRRAALPNAAAYQTQINQALREYLQSKMADERTRLLDDDEFILKVAQRIKQLGAA